MVPADFLWGALRIHGELLKLAITISQATVSRYMPPSTRGGHLYGATRSPLSKAAVSTGIIGLLISSVRSRLRVQIFDHDARQAGDGHRDASRVSTRIEYVPQTAPFASGKPQGCDRLPNRSSLL
jgi:hypothetical protein